MVYCPRCFKPTGCLFTIQGFACPLFYLLRAEQLQPGSRRWGVQIAPGRSNLGSAGHNYPNERQGRLSLHLPFHCAASVGSYLLIFGLKPYCAAASQVLPPTCSLPARQWGRPQSPRCWVCRWACWTVLSLLPLHRFPVVSFHFIPS